MSTLNKKVRPLKSFTCPERRRHSIQDTRVAFSRSHDARKRATPVEDPGLGEASQAAPQIRPTSLPGKLFVSSPSVKRPFHFRLRSPDTRQINSEHLREGGPGGPGSPLPKTVAGNVKNVIGWRGGAERGFLAAYSDCIHVIRTEGARVLTPDLTGKYMKVRHPHLSFGHFFLSKKNRVFLSLLTLTQHRLGMFFETSNEIISSPTKGAAHG